jgi:hypothetical protein
MVTESAAAVAVLPQSTCGKVSPAHAPTCTSLLATHGHALESALLRHAPGESCARTLCVRLAGACSEREAAGGGDEL